eukprot:TRINITY_DN18253_c0_g1_i1.p1 TRINITY_DN18253_c0_g1~~TRINITY_DN18253_c0_g1_i1.p1  ORF type:complete len:534 (+),score=128.77 TRINITY_DN18253_c0_g1_i1:48-1649(+)
MDDVDHLVAYVEAIQSNADDEAQQHASQSAESETHTVRYLIEQQVGSTLIDLLISSLNSPAKQHLKASVVYILGACCASPHIPPFRSVSHAEFVNGAVESIICALRASTEDERRSIPFMECIYYALGKIASAETFVVHAHRNWLFVESLQFVGHFCPSDVHCINLFKNVSWMLTALVDSANTDLHVDGGFRVFLQILNFYHHLVQQGLNDAEILFDFAHCLRVFTNNSRGEYVERFDAVIQSQMVAVVLQFLNREFLPVRALVDILVLLGNLSSAEDPKYTQHLLDIGILRYLKVLDHPDSPPRKDFMWVLSNIAAGTPDQIRSLVRANVFKIIMHKVSLEDEDEHVKYEGLWCIANATEQSCFGSKADILEHLLDMDCMPFLVKCLNSNNLSTAQVAASSILRLVQHGEGRVQDRITTQNDVLPEFIVHGGTASRLRMFPSDDYVSELPEALGYEDLPKYSCVMKVWLLRHLWKNGARNDGNLLKQSANQALACLYELDEILSMVKHKHQITSNNWNNNMKQLPLLLGKGII